MAAWEANAPDDGFDLEAGTPELSAPATASRTRAAVLPLPISPGLVGVATISLASPPRESGACRCGACLTLPVGIEWLD